MSADAAADADAADADAAAERRLNHSIPHTYFVRGIQLLRCPNPSKPFDIRGSEKSGFLWSVHDMDISS